MMEDTDGELYCTSKQLCTALGITEEAIWKIYERHKEELSALSLTKRQPKNVDSDKTGDRILRFLKENRTEFGIQRLRKSMRLWTAKDMFIIAVYSQSAVSKEFRNQLWNFVRHHAQVTYVTREEFQLLEKQNQQLAEQVRQLTAILTEAQPGLQQQASAAGTALRAQKSIKHLRLVR